MSLPKVIDINRFNVDSERCPQELRLVLRADIRDVFTRRRDVANAVLSNAGIDALIDKWWLHHRNIIRAASIRKEWDWKTLSLHFDENVSRPVNFAEAFKVFLTLLARPNYLDRSHWSAWEFSATDVVPSSASSNFYLGGFHTLLYRIYICVFRKVVLENKDIVADASYTDADARLSASYVNYIQKYINSYTETIDISETKKYAGAFSALRDVYMLLGSKEPIPFNKLPKAIFDKIVSLGLNDEYSKFMRDLTICFEKNENFFVADLYKAIGAHQMCGDVGPVKTTLCNKLVKSYYDWLAALTIGFSGNPISMVAEDNTFAHSVEFLKSFIFYTDNPFKVREEGREGFKLVNYGTYEQLFARLQENVKGSLVREYFIVSFHPCDMITCSLGYNWSSCQSWIDDFSDLPSGYGIGNNYSGMYNRGNFQFLCGNGFIAYVPHEKLEGVPQYLWAKKKRCLIWVGDNLDCMRQNYFYPGKPTDQETLAFGKVIREYIQNVCAPFNYSNGTIDWKVFKGVGKNWSSSIDEAGFDKFEERYDPSGGIRYDDPIMAISYLKTKTEKSYLYYALDFPRLDTGLVSPNYNRIASFFSHTSGTCPVCGKHTSHGGICSKCEKELIEHNGHKVHPSDLVSINVDGKIIYKDITELKDLENFITVEDGTVVEFKSAFKVHMPSGIKYFKELPDYVKQCKVCKEYFHPSFMIGDVCIDHFNSSIASESEDVTVDLEEVLKAFMLGTLSFDCNDSDNLMSLLKLLDNHNVKWVSGRKASEYCPSSNSAKKMYLSLNRGKLIISAQAKSTVVKVSNLFKKGGE